MKCYIAVHAGTETTTDNLIIPTDYVVFVKSQIFRVLLLDKIVFLTNFCLFFQRGIPHWKN